MNYIPPFSHIRRSIDPVDKFGNIKVEYETLVEIFKKFLRVVDVDEEWYLNTYPDVATAVKAGEYHSAKHHFVENGYFEGRVPYNMTVDEEWYLSANPDISDAVKRRDFASANDHFQRYGYTEGRLPSAL